jgi:uncharacterized membrane protein YhaH (DUF805 family)
MESLRNLEVVVASWYETMPHLPKNGQKWLAENVWWLVLVGVILSGFVIFAVLSATLFASVLIATGTGGPVGAAIGGITLLVVFVWLAFLIANVVIGALAVSPLKAKQRKGWSLLFLIAVINAASLVLAFLFSFNLPNLIFGLFSVAVGAYFLFEVRDYFVTAKSQHHVSKEKKQA